MLVSVKKGPQIGRNVRSLHDRDFPEGTMIFGNLQVASEETLAGTRRASENFPTHP